MDKVTEEKLYSPKKDEEESFSSADSLLQEVASLTPQNSPSWDVARDVISKVKPIPWTFWVLIRSVWGASDYEKVKVDSSQFNIVDQLVFQAAKEEDFVTQAIKRADHFPSVFNAIGPHAIASLCFMHAVCKRVAINLPERVYKAIIDDALLRARLGVVLSKYSPKVSIGAGLLVGFSGRAGLAIQLASGTEVQATDSLKSLAKGSDMSSTGMAVYGCDPLQVAALALISGGCNKQIAMGISSFTKGRDSLVVGSQQYDWMMYFSLIESLRLGRIDSVDISDFEYLAINPSEKKDLQDCAKQAFRSGHNFEWLFQNLSEMNKS